MESPMNDAQTLQDLDGFCCLVTGGSGFFGDFFVGQVLARGARVINVDIVSSVREHDRLTNLRVDIRDQTALAAAFRSAPASTRSSTLRPCSRMATSPRPTCCR